MRFPKKCNVPVLKAIIKREGPTHLTVKLNGLSIEPCSHPGILWLVFSSAAIVIPLKVRLHWSLIQTFQELPSYHDEKRGPRQSHRSAILTDNPSAKVALIPSSCFNNFLPAISPA